jgi:hypothetical protein
MAAIEKEMEAMTKRRSPAWGPPARKAARRNESIDTNATSISDDSADAVEVRQIKSGNVMVAVGEVGVAF